MVFRVNRDERLQLLRGVWLFSACSTRELAQVGALATPVDVPERAVLCREGETGHDFFVIVDGEARVTIAGTHLATLRPGQFFGELALLDQGPRVATVTASTPMKLLVLGRREFEKLISGSMPSVARKMLRALGARLRERDAALASAPSTT